MTGRRFLFRLPKGADIHESLYAFCRQEGVRRAWVSVIGATTRTRLGYYDQRRRRYFDREFRGALEILSCTGNVSLKEGEPFAHLHAILGDGKYRVLGGHLFASEVFAAEVSVEEIPGPALRRVPDPETGLALWKSSLSPKKKQKSR